jgi:biopolymer transport protein ExbB/TolQ
MRSTMGKKVVVVTLVVAAGMLAAAWSPLSIGQEGKAAKKAKGRLPAYYADIVSGDQREKIYAIQAKYQEQINALQEQLAALNKKQTDEIEAVLTSEQLERLRKAQADGAAKKKKSTVDKKAADAKAKADG